ncbi:MAG: hypothetical protein AAFQ94_05460 [Bacteroidota bacterium]
MAVIFHSRIFKHFLLIGIFALFLSVFNANAQSVLVGGAVVYGDDVEQLGVHLRGYYNLRNERICFGPEYSHFFTANFSKDGGQATKKLKEYNFNIHYVFELNETLGFYPLTGLNYSTEIEEQETLVGWRSFKEDALGVNLGFGFHKVVGRSVLFVEFDHLFSELSQNSALIGLFYNLSKKNEHGE